jgi:hypothetical protein
MKPFRSRDEMLDAHELMFGDAGRQCTEIVLRWASTLFAVPLDVLNIRVVLAPVELGPYNRHAGYHYGPEGKGAFILGNRHVVCLNQGTLTLVQDQWLSDDFVVHELTHQRQTQLLHAHGSGSSRPMGRFAATRAIPCAQKGVPRVPAKGWSQ